MAPDSESARTYRALADVARGAGIATRTHSRWAFKWAGLWVALRARMFLIAAAYYTGAALFWLAAFLVLGTVGLAGLVFDLCAWAVRRR